MRHFEDHPGTDPGDVVVSPAVLTVAALVSVALGVAYAVGAGLQEGDPVQSVALALGAGFHLGWAGWVLAQPERALKSMGAVVFVGFGLVVGLPALLGGHHPDHAGSVESADGDGLAVGDAGGVGVGAGDESASGPAAAETSTPEHAHGDHNDHDDQPVISLYDPRVTPAQRDAARRLIDETTSGMSEYPDVESVMAAGYVSIGDGITGFEHFIHPGFMTDGVDLDPDRIESIVARVNPDGSRDIVSAMYLLAPGSTMDDVPDIAGPLTVWHDHQDLCWDGIRVVGRVGSDGSCPRGEFRGTAPMMHVWLVPHPCGPFAGLEGHGGSCAHDH